MANETVQIDWEKVKVHPRVREVFREAESRMRMALSTPNPTLVLGRLLEVEGFIETEKANLRQEFGYNPNLDYWIRVADSYLDKFYRLG